MAVVVFTMVMVTVVVEALVEVTYDLSLRVFTNGFDQVSLQV